MNDDESAIRAIVALLELRAADATICPSEAARAIDATAWREAMPRVHAAARRLATSGAVALTQGGTATNPDDIVGAYRIASTRPKPQGPTIAREVNPGLLPPSSPRE